MNDIKIINFICNEKPKYTNYLKLSPDAKEYLEIICTYIKTNKPSSANTQLSSQFGKFYKQYSLIKQPKIPKQFKKLTQLPAKFFSYYPKYIPLSTRLDFIHNIEKLFPPKRQTRKMWGKTITTPRDQLTMGENTYRYSGMSVYNVPWIKSVEHIRDIVENIPEIKAQGIKFNLVLINGYNATDGVDWHSDDESNLDKTKPIVSVSIGGTRDFDVRVTKDKKDKWRVPLYSGDIIIMKKGTQQIYQHKVPKRKNVPRRYNLTFRIYKD